MKLLATGFQQSGDWRDLAFAGRIENAKLLNNLALQQGRGIFYRTRPYGVARPGITIQLCPIVAAQPKVRNICAH